jgi:hypothetical protein
MSTTQEKQPDRDLYRVTLFLSDGSKPVYNRRAESPEAAQRKIRERELPAIEKRGLVIESSMAELLEEGK